MEDTAIFILQIEDNPGDARITLEVLAKELDVPYHLLQADCLSAGISFLEQKPIDIIILDLQLPDSCGLDSLVKIHEKAPNVPIVILTGSDDEELAKKAVQDGAQDYLAKDQLLQRKQLVRTIFYAIERQKMLYKLQSMAVIDELTGLNNRRGFINLAIQHMKLSKRINQGFSILYLDLDNMKEINDSFGHQNGDQALIKTAALLKQTFRESDIIGRLGGDEFAILTPSVLPESQQFIINRLQMSLEKHNKTANLPYAIHVSIGSVYVNPQSPDSIEDLLAAADRLMYEQKRKKREV